MEQHWRSSVEKIVTKEKALWCQSDAVQITQCIACAQTALRSDWFYMEKILLFVPLLRSGLLSLLCRISTLTWWRSFGNSSKANLFQGKGQSKSDSKTLMKKSQSQEDLGGNSHKTPPSCGEKHQGQMQCELHGRWRRGPSCAYPWCQKLSLGMWNKTLLEVEELGVRVSPSKSEAMVLIWKSLLSELESGPCLRWTL